MIFLPLSLSPSRHLRLIFPSLVTRKSYTDSYFFAHRPSSVRGLNFSLLIERIQRITRSPPFSESFAVCKTAIASLAAWRSWIMALWRFLVAWSPLQASTTGLSLTVWGKVKRGAWYSLMQLHQQIGNREFMYRCMSKEYYSVLEESFTLHLYTRKDVSD